MESKIRTTIEGLTMIPPEKLERAIRSGKAPGMMMRKVLSTSGFVKVKNHQLRPKRVTRQK